MSDLTKFELPEKYCEATSNSLTFKEDTPYEVWEKVGSSLKKVGGAIQLWLGDWLNFGERVYGEKYSQALDESHYELQTLQKFASVAGRTKDTRNNLATSPTLMMGHWDSIANIEPAKQEKWVKKVEDNNLTVKELRQAIQEVKKQNKIELPIPKGEFDCIVIDPPWAYGTEYDSESRRVASPYPELSQEELKKIVLPSAKNSSLWLWTTHKFIWDAKELMDLWGFEYKAVLTWNKEKIGMGAWLRMQGEFCLLGIKGKPNWNLTNERDILSVPRREHSRKPDEFYSMIEKLTSAKNKLDFFGREGREGWTVYGNEPTKY